MGFTGADPRPSIRSSAPSSPPRSAQRCVVAFGNLRKAFVAFQQFLHNDEGCAGFGAAMQQVVLAAL